MQPLSLGLGPKGRSVGLIKLGRREAPIRVKLGKVYNKKFKGDHFASNRDIHEAVPFLVL